MTDEQNFFFDLKGWMLLPGVLSAAEIEAVKAHVCAGGSSFTGPAQELLDHPTLVEVLRDLLGTSAAKEDGYGFRCEGSFVTIRRTGDEPGAMKPHVGSSGPGPQSYQTNGKRLYSGMTRVVWELNPVEKGDGGTLFLSGSHKADFPLPASVLQPNNPHLETYSCPAGSVLIFTESLLHAATRWVNPNVERVAIFNTYNSVQAQFHRLNLPHEVVCAMPAKRQSLFRGVYGVDFMAQPPALNRFYSLDNRAL